MRKIKPHAFGKWYWFRLCCCSFGFRFACEFGLCVVMCLVCLLPFITSTFCLLQVGLTTNDAVFFDSTPFANTDIGNLRKPINC